MGNLRNIHIGTSGWSYKHWKGIFYDPKMKPTDYLRFYSRSFSIAEINTSFYHLPLISTVEKWEKEVPARFKFCPKISRYLTHMKKLHDPEEPLEKFFEVFKPMQKKMGPVLVQLPPSLKFNYEVAENFFSVLEKHYSKYSFALEIRNTTWLEDKPLALLQQYNIAFVISQSAGHFPYAEIVTAKNIYVRFHGPEALYASSYSDAYLKKFASQVREWQEQKHVIWIFFNNDIHGYAFQNAKRLTELLEG